MHPWSEVKEFICRLLGLFPSKSTDLAHIGKAYYFANLFAMKDYGTVVSTHYCVRMPYGPGIDDYQEILAEMEEEKTIARAAGHEIRLIHKRHYARFRKCIDEAIRRAYEEVKDKSFNQLVSATHSLRSYKKATDGEPIDFSEDILRAYPSITRLSYPNYESSSIPATTRMRSGLFLLTRPCRGRTRNRTPRRCRKESLAY